MQRLRRAKRGWTGGGDRIASADRIAGRLRSGPRRLSERRPPAGAQPLGIRAIRAIRGQDEGEGARGNAVPTATR